MIRVENALRSFPEEHNFETGGNQTQGRVTSGRNDQNAGGSAAKKPRTNVTKDGQGTGGRLVVGTVQTGKGARTRATSAKHAHLPKKKAAPKQTANTGMIAVELAKVKELREMLEDRTLATDGEKAVLVKRLVAYRKSNGAKGDDLRYIKAPKIRKPTNEPVVMDLTQDGEPAEETHVPHHAVPAAAAEVMQAGTDVRVAGAQDQAQELTAADLQKAIHRAVKQGVYEATKTTRATKSMSQQKQHLLYMAHKHQGDNAAACLMRQCQGGGGYVSEAVGTYSRGSKVSSTSRGTGSVPAGNQVTRDCDHRTFRHCYSDNAELHSGTTHKSYSEC